MGFKMFRLSLTFLVAGAAACCWAAPAGKQKLSPDAAQATAQSSVNVIVQWTIPTGQATAQKISALGGSVISQFKTINAGVYSLPPSGLAVLEADPAVVYISLDRPVHHKLDVTAATINAPTVWNSGWVGTGVGVAVIDSGVNTDPNIVPSSGKGSRIVYKQDFTGGDGNDHYGHGQHVAGIIASSAATEANPSGPVSGYTRLFKGVAPGANIVNLRVLDNNGQGTDSEVIAAIDEAVALKNTYNIRVINLSLGRPVYESYTLDPLCQAVESAWKAGIVVVVAAGNDGRDNTYENQGYGTINAPGNDPHVITVGAMKTFGTYTRADDLMASYSSKGPTQVDHIVKPDIVAPGNLIVSLLAAGSTLVNQNPSNRVVNSYFEETNAGQAKQTSNNFFTLSGTSMATGVVSGAAADLVHANPALTPDQIKILLMQTASKTFPTSSTVTDPTSGLTYVDYYDIFTVGAGYLDLAAAMSAITTVPAVGAAISPTAIYDPTTTIVTLSYDASSVFAIAATGVEAAFGAQAVWSSSELTANKCLWGASGDTASRALWGAATDTASKALWGASAVSSASSTVAESVSISGE